MIGRAPVAVGLWASVWDAVDLYSLTRVNVWVYNIRYETLEGFRKVSDWISAINEGKLQRSEKFSVVPKAGRSKSGKKSFVFTGSSGSESSDSTRYDLETRRRAGAKHALCPINAQLDERMFDSNSEDEHLERPVCMAEFDCSENRRELLVRAIQASTSSPKLTTITSVSCVVTNWLTSTSPIFKYGI